MLPAALSVPTMGKKGGVASSRLPVLMNILRDTGSSVCKPNIWAGLESAAQGRLLRVEGPHLLTQ